MDVCILTLVVAEWQRMEVGVVLLYDNHPASILRMQCDADGLGCRSLPLLMIQGNEGSRSIGKKFDVVLVVKWTSDPCCHCDEPKCIVLCHFPAWQMSIRLCYKLLSAYLTTQYCIKGSSLSRSNKIKKMNQSLNLILSSSIKFAMIV